MQNVDSEKYLERKLVDTVKQKGGLCIKLVSSIGLPDRMCLLPNKHITFIELKTKGQKPRSNQSFVHNKLRQLGFTVLVIDTNEKLTNYIKLL